MTKRKITIRYIYAGIRQYVDFFEIDGAFQTSKLFRPRYSDKDFDLSSYKTIDEVLEFIKSISFSKRAEIYLINDRPKTLENFDFSYFNNVRNTYKNFITELTLDFYKTQLLDIIRNNNWKITTSNVGYLVLIEKYEEGIWNNVKNNFDFEYLCYNFLSQFDFFDDKLDLKRETEPYLFYSYKLFLYIRDYIKNSDEFIESSKL